MDPPPPPCPLRYFEGIIAAAVAAEAEANAPAEEGLSEEERVEVTRLRREIDDFSQKYEEVLDSLRIDEVRAGMVGAMSCVFAIR